MYEFAMAATCLLMAAVLLWPRPRKVAVRVRIDQPNRHSVAGAKAWRMLVGYGSRRSGE